MAARYHDAMQHLKQLCPLLSLAALVVAPAAVASPEAACQQLRAALERELAILRSVQDSSSAAAALPQLQAVLRELAEMDRSYEAEKALWEYIDNTTGVKLPLVELLQSLAIEFTRLEDAAFFGHEGLRAQLAPQLQAPQKESGKE